VITASAIERQERATVMTAALNNAGRYRRAASQVSGADNVRIASGVTVVASGAVVELTRLDGETG
jgi:hypothetical protein